MSGEIKSHCRILGWAITSYMWIWCWENREKPEEPLLKKLVRRAKPQKMAGLAIKEVIQHMNNC